MSRPVQAQPIIDSRGYTTGYTSGPRPIQYAPPVTRIITPEEERSNREPAEFDIWSRLEKVPKDHPKRSEWERDAYTLTAALRQAWAAEVEMEAEGYMSDAQPDDVADDDQLWIDDPYGLNWRDDA